MSALLTRPTDFYRQLLNEGKQKTVAVIACLQKLLVILNTMLKNNEA